MSHSCGCGHSHKHDETSVHALMDNALVLSGSWSYTDPASAEVLEARVKAGLNQLAVLLAEDGAVLGHIKALLQYGESGIAFSITRLDAVDQTEIGTWPPAGPAGEGHLTVNVLSLVHRPAVTQTLLEELFAP